MVDKQTPIEPATVDPENLRTAEFEQTQTKLDSLVGKTVVAAQIEDTRITVTTTDGQVYFFYGFMGGRDAGG